MVISTGFDTGSAERFSRMLTFFHLSRSVREWLKDARPMNQWFLSFQPNFPDAEVFGVEGHGDPVCEGDNTY